MGPPLDDSPLLVAHRALLVRRAGALPAVRLDVTDLRGTALFSVEFSPEDAQFTAAVRDETGDDIGLVAKAKGIRKIHFDLKASNLTLGTVEDA